MIINELLEDHPHFIDWHNLRGIEARARVRVRLSWVQKIYITWTISYLKTSIYCNFQLWRSAILAWAGCSPGWPRCHHPAQWCGSGGCYWKHTRGESQPHLHLVVQIDTFNLNLCTIRIEIGAMPSCNHCSGTPRAAPSLSYSWSSIFNTSFTATFPAPTPSPSS